MIQESSQSGSSVVTISAENIQELSPLLRGVACSAREIIFGDDGLHEFIACGNVLDFDSWEDGRFFAVAEEADYFRVLTDPMGQDTLYFYSAEGIGSADRDDWLISNSFLSLAQYASGLGKQLTLAPEVLATGLATGGTGFGAQLISNQTPIKEISVLPIGCEIEVCKKTKKATTVRKRAGDWLLEDASKSFSEALEFYIRKAVGRIRALSECDRFELSFDLSGGHDSRAIVGLAMLAGVDFNKNTIYSNPKWEMDLVSARLVSAEYGFPLSVKRKPIPQAPGAYDLWKAGALGVYLPVYAHGAPSNASAALSFHGGNFLSKQFGERAPREWADHLAKKMPSSSSGEETKRLFLNAFESIDVDPDSQWGSQLHYLNFRSRFHYGRNWVGSTRQAIVTPLISQDFARAAFKFPTKDYNELRPSLELLMAIDNRLAEIPFDLPEKCFSRRQIEESPFFGRAFQQTAGSIQSVSVYGRAPTIPLPICDDSRPARERLSEDLSRYSDAAIESGVITAHDVQRSYKMLQESPSLPHGGRLAALVVSAGTFAELTRGKR